MSAEFAHKAPVPGPEDSSNRRSQVEGIVQKFERDPSRILAALVASQKVQSAEEDITVVLPVMEIENATFPPPEFKVRWRLAYARARASPTSAKLTSRAFFSASHDTFAKLAAEGPILTWSGVALREEVGKPTYRRIAARIHRLSDAPRTEMAFRTFVSKTFEAGDYQIRPPRDWAQLVLECLVEFYPAAALEIRRELYPWEALPAPSSSFLSEVQEYVAQANRDPLAALQRALAL